MFLTCARLLVLQSFKTNSGKESEVEVSSRYGEGEFSSITRTKIFEEMLYCVVRNVAFVWPPLY